MGIFPTVKMGATSSQLGQLAMHLGTGVTVVESVKGPVILRANQALVYANDIRKTQNESLLCLSQMREYNVFVDECPQKDGGA